PRRRRRSRPVHRRARFGAPRGRRRRAPQHARAPRAPLRRRPRVLLRGSARPRLPRDFERPVRPRFGLLGGGPRRRGGGRPPPGRGAGGGGMRARSRLRVAAGAALLAVLAAGIVRGAPPSPPYERAIERSRALLDEALQLYPGTSVAVAVGHDVVWSTAFGYADVERHRAVSRSTQLRLYD